jgi:hypothetical protein
VLCAAEAPPVSHRQKKAFNGRRVKEDESTLIRRGEVVRLLIRDRGDHSDTIVPSHYGSSANK